MATPTTSGVPVLAFDRADTLVPWLVWNQKWGAGPLGEGVTLDYSFSADASRFIANYGEGLNEPASLRQLSDHEKGAIESALAAWMLVTDVTFTFVEETDTLVGDIRFGKTENSPGTTAHAYLPDAVPEAGDVWFKAATWNDALTPGTFDYYVILHEIGHALGLEHTFSDDPIAPPQFDNHLYSVMAYRQGPNSVPNGPVGSFYPTTPMFYDILAMESVYGPNLTANAGDTVYQFNEGQRYFQTVYDASGVDTIQYNGTGAATISLVIGSFSRLSATIFFDVGSSNETVAIGPSTWIENAIGGFGADTLIGNDRDNALNGNLGADMLAGGGGADRLFGGDGNDVLAGEQGDDSLNGSSGADTMRGGLGDDTYIVDEASDVVIELANEGVDAVRSSVTRTLGAHQENLTLLGAAAINATGNSLGNALTGNNAANALSGMAGADTLRGLGGADALSGGGGRDSLNGGGGDDVLDGAGAADTLTGGAGRDTFVFSAALGPANRDTITDYFVAADTIQIDDAAFAGLALGALAAAAFHTGAGAHDSDDRIIYNPATGVLFFDADGYGGAGKVQFAVLAPGLLLNAGEFVVI